MNISFFLKKTFICVLLAFSMAQAGALVKEREKRQKRINRWHKKLTTKATDSVFAEFAEYQALHGITFDEFALNHNGLKQVKNEWDGLRDTYRLIVETEDITKKQFNKAVRDVRRKLEVELRRVLLAMNDVFAPVQTESDDESEAEGEMYPEQPKRVRQEEPVQAEPVVELEVVEPEDNDIVVIVPDEVAREHHEEEPVIVVPVVRVENVVQERAVSLVEQLINEEMVIFDDMNVGETCELNDDERILLQLMESDILVIQLPGLSQESARCGTHTFENSGPLCRSRNVYELIKTLNSSDLAKAIKTNVKDLKTLRRGSLQYVQKHKLMWEEYRKYVNSDGMMSYMEMMKNNGNSVCQNVNGVYRTIFSVVAGNDKTKKKKGEKKKKKKTVSQVIQDKFENEDLMRQALDRFRRTGRPEVFIVNTGGHWVVLRVERMSNGVVAVILVDSFYRCGDDIIDKIVVYDDWLLPFARLFRDGR